MKPSTKPRIGDYIKVTGGFVHFVMDDEIQPVSKDLLGNVGQVVPYRGRLIQIIDEYRVYKCAACSNATWTCTHGDDVQEVDYIAVELLDGPEKGKKVSVDSLDYRILHPLEILAAQAWC